MIKYYSNGKLLLTGEYLVLDGALSLAIPTQFGQSLTVESIDEQKLIWKSINEIGNVWFEDAFLLQNNEILNQVQDDNDISNRLIEILKAAKRLNPNFLNSKTGYKVTTKLDFPQFWGLGTSSTLIQNIAKWANVDAYQLLEHTFGGSGYDIACAQHDFPITYQLKNEFTNEIPKHNSTALSAIVQDDKKRKICKVNFNPTFKKHLYFVHLNRKQNSSDAIARYNSNKNNLSVAISEISDISSEMISRNSLENFQSLLISHEAIISKIIKQEPVKNLLFPDFNGAIKSLGAWGGDYILVTGNEESVNYFREKGFHTIIPYSEMVLTR